MGSRRALDDEPERIVKNGSEAGSIARAERMRNERVANGRRARGRLLAVLSTAVFVLACSGLSRFPAKAEPPHAGGSKAGKRSEAPMSGQALGRRTDQFRLSKEAYREPVADSKA